MAEIKPKMEDWTDEEVAQLKKMWESKIGKKYKQRIADLQDEVVQTLIFTPTPEVVTRYAGIACGYAAVLQDIDALTNSKKDEGAGKTKK